VTCTRTLRAARPVAAAATVAAAMMAAVATARTARAQNPTPPPVPEAPVLAPPIAPYRAPVLALVQPPPSTLAGGAPLTVPQDRPVLVFRFAQGEPSDPIDAASFRVAVDGRDRTAQFHVASGEAWGPIGDAAVGAPPLAAGAHQVAARICSTRGACGTVDVSVTAVPAAFAAPTDDAAAKPKASRRSRLLSALINASKKLLAP
jgi:hypothetical protein